MGWNNAPGVAIIFMQLPQSKTNKMLRCSHDTSPLTQPTPNHNAPCLTSPRLLPLFFIKKAVYTVHNAGFYYSWLCCNSNRGQKKREYETLVFLQRGVAWCAVLWCRVVWGGVEWCGVVWCCAQASIFQKGGELREGGASDMPLRNISEM